MDRYIFNLHLLDELIAEINLRAQMRNLVTPAMIRAVSAMTVDTQYTEMSVDYEYERREWWADF